MVGGRGGSPSLLRRGEMPYGKDTASSGPRGPWPDLSAYARQPALTSLFEATRKSLGKRYCAGQPGSRKVVKGAGKGAGKGLKPG